MTREEMFSALNQMSQFCAERVYKARAAMMWDEVVLYTRWTEAVDCAVTELTGYYNALEEALRGTPLEKEVIVMPEVCSDNRFEIIADYKRRLVEGTNIETKPEEMAVLDSILFRFWQMGWLKEQEPVKPRWTHPTVDKNVMMCGSCGIAIPLGKPNYCPWCGRKVKWNG